MTDFIFGLLTESTIKASVLIVVGLFIGWALRNRAANERYWLWRLVFIALLALPLIAVVGPSIRVPETEITSSFSSIQDFTNALGSADLASGSITERTLPAETALALEGSGIQIASKYSLAKLLVLSYLFVAIVFFVRLTFAHLRILYGLRNLAPLNDESIGQEIQNAVDLAGIQRKLDVRLGVDSLSPWTWGGARPVVVVPGDFSDWTEPSRRQAIVHELTHVSQWDHLFTILSQLACALNWFNPLVWIAQKRLRCESERACDDRVLDDGAVPVDYADQLLSIARNTLATRANNFVTVHAMASGTHLSSRIRSILDTTQQRSNMTRKRKIIYSILAAAMILPLASLESQEADEAVPYIEIHDILTNGPMTSDELELAIDTLVADAMSEEAVALIVRYIHRDPERDGDAFCAFCQSILASEGTPDEHRHTAVMQAALEILEQEAIAAEDGNRLVYLARLAGKNASAYARGRAMYQIVMALNLDIAEQSKLAVVSFLAQEGRFEAARVIADELISDAATDSDSFYFESNVVKQWLRYIDSEIHRGNALTDRIADSIDGEERSSEPYDVVSVMKTNPVYPQAAAQAGLEGFATVYFVVDTNGRPKNITLHESSDPVFDDAAIAALNDFRFLPMPNEVPHANRFIFSLPK